MKLGLWFTNENIIGSKWIYSTKYHDNGLIDRYKAFVVAKGNKQNPGLDYDETFSLVVKLIIIRVILSVVIYFGWTLKQLGVKNAFLYEFLHERVYMEQPFGFADPKFPNYVCLLHKSIYDLKQTPCPLFDSLRSLISIDLS